MNYKTFLQPDARKFLRKLNQAEMKHIIKKLRQVEENPFKYLEHFEEEGVFKLRIGNYRALVTVNQKSCVLTIHVLDKRGRVYK